jgi:hypothetical protein
VLKEAAKKGGKPAAQGRFPTLSFLPVIALPTRMIRREDDASQSAVPPRLESRSDAKISATILTKDSSRRLPEVSRH